MNIKVSIPVEVDGHTGQREEWSSLTKDYTVSIEDDGRVRLEKEIIWFGSAEKIWFDLDDLLEAVKFIKEREDT